MERAQEGAHEEPQIRGLSRTIRRTFERKRQTAVSFERFQKRPNRSIYSKANTHTHSQMERQSPNKSDWFTNTLIGCTRCGRGVFTCWAT